MAKKINELEERLKVSAPTQKVVEEKTLKTLKKSELIDLLMGRKSV